MYNPGMLIFLSILITVLFVACGLGVKSLLALTDDSDYGELSDFPLIYIIWPFVLMYIGVFMKGMRTP